jgi:hypothetical protein
MLTDTDRLDYLLADGDWSVPCSRYGSCSSECAPVAIALDRIVTDATGEGGTLESLDYAMGLVVNNHDDVEYTIRAHGEPADIALLNNLEG